MNKLLFILLIIICFSEANGQAISGKIFDAKTKEAIPFAAIYYDQTFVGTSANKSGNFTLKVFKNNTNPLVVSAVGYYSVSITNYSNNKYLEISLNP